MEQRESVGTMLLGAVGTCWQGAGEAAWKGSLPGDAPVAASSQAAPRWWSPPSRDGHPTTYINGGRGRHF